MIRNIIRCMPLVLVLHLTAKAQPAAGDLDLIRMQAGAAPGQEGYYAGSLNNRAAISAHTGHGLAKFNPLLLVLQGSMLLYQHVISPQLSRGCPYEITCSNFSKQAIQEYGIVKGVFLSADRILRCNRIGILDVHPLDISEATGKIADSPNKYR